MSVGKTLVLLLCLLFQLFNEIKALEIYMSVEAKVLPGGENTCGVLHCLEEGEEPRLQQISDLIVFKATTTKSSRARTSIASVSERQPRVSRLWDGIKVDGTWTKQKAELKLYLTEKDDCSASHFICEIHFVDGAGDERIAVSQLGKVSTNPSGLHTNLQGDGASVAGGFPQLSTTVHETYSTLERTLHHLHDRLEDKLQALANRLEDKISLLDRSFLKLESKVDTLEENTKDKNQRFFNDFSEKIKTMTHSLSYTESTLKSLMSKSENTLQQNALLLSSLNSQSQIKDANVTFCSPKDFAEIVEKLKTAEKAKEEFKLVQSTSCTRQESTYRLVIPSNHEAPYLCDTHTEGGGWIVIQRRRTGKINFYRNWAAYKEGFGSLAEDFWLGNERIHQLTSEAPFELNVSLEYNGQSAFARYQTFSLDGEANNYTLRLGAYSGTAGDALASHKNMAFSTFDNDHDKHSANCAVIFQGAWWYSKCHSSNLNGEWEALDNKGPRWSTLTGANPVNFSEMKIRRL
ncbi:ficolin-1 [Plakobranchus ocellatus]|uniref:Ficolin-1 n=1 Tax=Plakobranchus ocellatus TaxID=259542 RepID=A0AAV4B7U7_9GAST|nr:ficolin-1 [Plakobranchus ocellatus]